MAENYCVLTPEQRAAWNRAIVRDAEHLGIDPTLAQALCVPGSFATLNGEPIKPGARLPDGGAMLVVSTPHAEGDRIRDRLPSTTAPLPPVWTKAMFHARSAQIADERQQLRRLDGEAAAKRVAYWVREDLERRYPDSVNARCVGMGGESGSVGVLAVTWMRGREVFHRRYPVDSAYVAQAGAKMIAEVMLLTVTNQINATEGAERP